MPDQTDVLNWRHIELHLIQAWEDHHRNLRAQAVCWRVDEAAVQPAARRANGSDADRIDAWPEPCAFGTQLGPNRNGPTS